MNLLEQLQAMLASTELTLPIEQQNKLIQLVELLTKRNKSYNLT